MKKLRFSLVIPLAPWRNAEILSSIKALNYPASRYEIIVQKGLNVPDNRNEGVRKAKGEIIVFLDDDAFIDDDFLANVDEFFKKNPQIDVLGGPQLTPDSDTFFPRVSGYALADPLSGPGVVNKRYQKARLTLNASSSYITGANLICRRTVFKELSFKREIYPSDDVNFVDEAKKKGHRVAYSPDIVIYHKRRDTLKGLIKQIYDYGRARTRHKPLSQVLAAPLFFVPMLFVIYLALLPTLFLVHSLFIVPLAFYVILVLVFSLYESIRNKEALAFFALPFFFLVIHVSYGAGFFIGFLERNNGTAAS